MKIILTDKETFQQVSHWYGMKNIYGAYFIASWMKNGNLFVHKNRVNGIYGEITKEYFNNFLNNELSRMI